MDSDTKVIMRIVSAAIGVCSVAPIIIVIFFLSSFSGLDLGFNFLKSGSVQVSLENELDFEAYKRPAGQVTTFEESKAIWAFIGEARNRGFNTTAFRYQCTEFAAYCSYVYYGQCLTHGNGSEIAGNLIRSEERRVG